MICGPSIGGDLAAITNYPLFCHLSICTSYHRIRQLASLLQHSIYTEYLNRWHNCPAYVSSIFREAYMLTEQRQAFLSNRFSWGLNQCAWPLVKFMAPSVVEIFSIVLFGIKRISRPPHFLILQSPFASVLRIQFAHSNISCRHLSNHHWYLFQQNAPEMIWRFGCFKICQCWRSISILPLPSKFVRVHLYHCIDPSST